MMGASTVLQACEDHMPSLAAPAAPGVTNSTSNATATTTTTTTTTTTSWEIPEVPADSNFVDGVASRDVRTLLLQDEDVNEGNKNEEQANLVGVQQPDENLEDVWVRMFLPQSAVDSSSKLPILLHVHGGGFVRFSAATMSYHDFCKKIAKDANVLVVSLNHRLAPQHRLPAAYQDLFTALKWLQAQAKAAAPNANPSSSSSSSKDPWLASYADFSTVIFMGGSSGGNIVHNTLLHIAQAQPFPLLNFRGQILLQPFFSGVQRTKSELLLSEGPILTLSMSDQLWSIALPEDANRDHPFCNPVATGTNIPSNLPKALVLVGGRDLLHDRQVEYASALKSAAVEVKLVEYPDATHGFVTSDGTVSYIFMPEVLQFISSCQNTS